MLRPFWRVSITMNDEPEDLLVLPPIDESLKDKLIVLNAHVPESTPLPQSIEERRNFCYAIASELPAFVQALLNFEIPKELRSSRFGVTHYHNPRILEVLDDSTPETKLLEMIKSEIVGPWTGTAAELQSELQGTRSDVRYEAQKLLHWYGATGTYLGRLSKKYPQRFKLTRTSDSRKWEILP